MKQTDGKSLRGGIKQRGCSINRLSRILATAGLGGPRMGTEVKASSRRGSEGPS